MFLSIDFTLATETCIFNTVSCCVVWFFRSRERENLEMSQCVEFESDNSSFVMQKIQSEHKICSQTFLHAYVYYKLYMQAYCICVNRGLLPDSSVHKLRW